MVVTSFPVSSFPCNERGSVLGELVIIVPLMLLLTAITGVLGIFLMQFHIVNDSVRQGARLGAYRSAAAPTCSSLNLSAQDEASRVFADAGSVAPLGNMTSAWNNPTAAVVNGTWDGYTFKAVRVEMNRTASTGVRMFGLSAPTGASAKSVFMLNASCT